MSTRAVYTFTDGPGDKSERHSVYIHGDGYPSGALHWLQAALPYAWPLPRYEAMEFAAAFVAANKPRDRGGLVYLTRGPDFHGDLAFCYLIYFDEKARQLHVKAYESARRDEYKLIFEGTLDEFAKFAQDK